MVHWQNASFPSWKGGFDSRYLLYFYIIFWMQVHIIQKYQINNHNSHVSYLFLFISLFLYLYFFGCSAQGTMERGFLCRIRKPSRTFLPEINVQIIRAAALRLRYTGYRFLWDIYYSTWDCIWYFVCPMPQPLFDSIMDCIFCREGIPVI